MTTSEAPNVPSFSMDDFAAADTAQMEVLLHGRRTGWFWVFSGPGHPKTEALNNRRARERLHKQAQIEQAQVNGRKYKADEEAPEVVRARNVADIVGRLIDWTAIEIDGKPFPFSEGAATEFLSDPRRIAVLAQALEFLAEEKSFTPRSAEA